MENRGILLLNSSRVEANPVVWSHDPSMMWDPITEKYYSYSTDVYRPEEGLCEAIGIPVRSSEDLVHFRYEGTVLSKEAVMEGRRNEGRADTEEFWAPYTEYVKGEYRMYYSATRSFGSSESRIWLAVAKHPLGPFENRGIVADSWDTDDTFPNAIDAHVVWKEEESWLVYGSFFGGIFVKELDSATGLPKSGDPKEPGVCVARTEKGSVPDGPEGAAVMYREEEGFFYLFQSYGWLGDDYDIRVGRSRNIRGPYRDFHGKNLVDESKGMKLAGSYRFRADNPGVLRGADGFKDNWKWNGFRGPGHGTPFHDPVSGMDFFVHHIRDGAEVNNLYEKENQRNNYEIHYMMVRPMFFRDGWPLFGPEPWDGERPEPVSPREVQGKWEMIVFDDGDNRMKSSVDMSLPEGCEYLTNGIIWRCYDFENEKSTIVLSGITNSGLAYWGKFLYSNV